MDDGPPLPPGSELRRFAESPDLCYLQCACGACGWLTRAADGAAEIDEAGWPPCRHYLVSPFCIRSVSVPLMTTDGFLFPRIVGV